ncbi:hypothetical protein GCM10022243_63460 [Saccharothrix violaceirubra]|uniref:Uncharacterized protein n=1 Tax=Saccharothrix violaceirubra TaxID=413306 RepID=A0A7W7SXJ0_9PSEU|nr:hypothetical protein [Saccharothrix violaceirubra]MBB4962708.1 hypothetical protein [Saccharothrix violaceirubra]
MTDLLAALAALLDQVDPMPRDLALRATQALRARHDEHAATLWHDSTRHGARTLRFAGLDLHLDPTRGGFALTGLVTTGTHAVLHHPGRTRTVPVVDGWFHVDPVPRGPVKAVVDDVATPWFIA